MIKSVILSVQWYYYSENAVHYYHDYDYTSDDNGYAYGHDEGDDVITVDDEPPQQGGGEYSQGGQGQGQGQSEGPAQGGMGPEGGPATDTMGGEGGEMQQQPQQGGQGQGQGQGQGHGGPATDTMIIEEDSTMEDDETMRPYYGDDDEVEIEEEEEDIPCWLSVLAWSCVAWHFIGGLLGMFAGCNYKKCCAFMFWMWWVITMTVSFALGVIVFYFAGFHWCLLAMFTVGMAIGVYFTVKVKQFYNLLKSDAQPQAPAGYSDINITAAV